MAIKSGGGTIGGTGAVGGARGGVSSLGRIGASSVGIGRAAGAVGIRVGGVEGARIGNISASDMRVGGRGAFGLPAREGPAAKSSFRINSPFLISRTDTVSNHAGKDLKPGYARSLRVESLKPSQRRGSELFRIPKSGILSADFLTGLPKTENIATSGSPKRPFSERLGNRLIGFNRFAAVEAVLQRPAHMGDIPEGSKFTRAQTEIKPVKVETSDFFPKPKAKDVTDSKKSKAEAVAKLREQVLVANVQKKLTRILGPDQAQVVIRRALESAQAFKLAKIAQKAESSQPQVDIRAKGQRLGLAKVLGIQPGVDALASTQPNATAETSTTQTGSGEKTVTTIKTSERVKLVLEYKKKLAAQRGEQSKVENVKKSTNISTKRRFFQFYAHAHQARIEQAQRLYDQKLAENQAQGIGGVSGNQIGSEYALTQSQKSKALDQLGRNFQPDGSDAETKKQLTVAGDLTREKIYEIVAKHAPTEIVEGNVTTRESSKEEIAEVFEGLDKAPALIENLFGGSLTQTVTSSELKTVKERVEEKTESRISAKPPAEIPTDTENSAEQTVVFQQDSQNTQLPFKSLQEILDGLNLPKAS